MRGTRTFLSYVYDGNTQSQTGSGGHMVRDDFLHRISTIFVNAVLFVDKRKHVTIGITVTSRRGELLPPKLGMHRQARGKCYRIVTKSVWDIMWGITWDNV